MFTKKSRRRAEAGGDGAAGKARRLRRRHPGGICAGKGKGKQAMATLTLDEVDPALVRRLHDRAAAEGVSADELHRRILEWALGEPKTARDIVEAFQELGRLGLEIPMEDRDMVDDRPPLELYQPWEVLTGGAPRPWPSQVGFER